MTTGATFLENLSYRFKNSVFSSLNGADAKEIFVTVVMFWERLVWEGECMRT